MKYYICLVLVIGSSVLSLLEYNTKLNPDFTEDILPVYVQITLPGLVFSLFLTIILFKHMTRVESVLIFGLFLVGYFGMGLLSLVLKELALPLAGALGGIYIAYMLKHIFKYDIKQIRYFIFGFLGTTPGFILRFIPFELENRQGILLSVAVGFWQLIIGYLTLQEIKLTQQIRTNSLDDLLDQDIDEL